MLMPVQAILFDLDDTLIVDEAISKSAMEQTAALAAKLHGAQVPGFLADAKRLSQSLWRDNPCLAYCDEIGVTAEECLWGYFDSPGLAALRDWSLNFRRSLFDAVLRRYHAPCSFKGERFCHYRNSQRPYFFCGPSNYRTGSRSGSSSHTCRDKNHV